VEPFLSTRLTSHGPEETRRIGERIAGRLSPGSVVLLIGPLGSGKTVLAKGIARGMGIADEVVSPSYTIICEYPGEKPLTHIDLYRIEGKEEIENLGLDDILWGQGIVIVEWGEKLSLPLRRPPVRITFTMESGSSRSITVEGIGI
jgi:tRNA threonylcarbamoyladenosine biosynthesis protein TsaE